MGRGKSKPKKITPKRRPPKKKKRQLPEGLRKWNQIRSYLSKENKKLGRKYDGLGLNELAKSIFREYYYESISDSDIAKYISLEVPTFYSSALNLDSNLLGPHIYFHMDQAIRALPTGLLAKVNAGSYGEVKIKTSEYEYSASGLKEIIEAIREDAKNESEGFMFHGNIVVNDDKDRKKNKEPEHLVLFTLSIGGDYVSDVTNLPLVDVHPTEPENDLEKKLKKIDEDYKKGREQAKRLKEKEAKALKEEAKVKETKEERILKLKNENLRLQNEKAKNILALIKAGYTKEEVDKLLG